MLKSKHLTTAAAAVLLVGAASGAQAAPYAYGELSFSDLSLSGVLENSAVSILGSTVTSSSTANYAALPGVSQSASGNLTAGTNVVQAFPGTSSAPGQNVFGRQLQAASAVRGDAQIVGAADAGDAANVVGKSQLMAVPGTASATAGTSAGVNIAIASATAALLGFTASSSLITTTAGPGEGANAQTAASFTINRGDARIVGAINAGNAANVVSEPWLTVVPGTASAAAGTSTAVNIAVASATAVLFGFTASSSLIATTTGPGEGATAQTAASFTITEGGTTIASLAPNALNFSVSSTGGTGDNMFSSGPTSYSTGPFTLGPGNYQLQLLSALQKHLDTSAVPNVPEPASMALLGAGLLGLGFVRRRARSKPEGRCCTD